MQIRNVNTKNETGKVAFTRDGNKRMVVGEQNDIHFCHTCQHGFVSPDHAASEIHQLNTSILMMCGIGFSGFDSDKPVSLLPISEMLMPEGSLLLESNKLLRKDEYVYRYYATGEPLPEEDSFLRKTREERARNGAISWYMIIVPSLYHTEGIDLAGYIGAYYNNKNKNIEPVILLRKIYQSKGYAKKAVDILCRFIGIYPDDSKDDDIFFFRNSKTIKAGKGGAVDETFYRVMRARRLESFSEKKMESYRQAYAMVLKVWSSAFIIDNVPSFNDFIKHYVSMSDNCYRTIAHSEYIENILSQMTLYISYHKENQRCENLIQTTLAPIGNRCISHQEDVIIRYTQANGFPFDMRRSTVECQIGFIKDKFMERMLDMFMSRYTLSLNYTEETRARKLRTEIRFKPYTLPGSGQSHLESSNREWWKNRLPSSDALVRPRMNDLIACYTGIEKTGKSKGDHHHQEQPNRTPTTPEYRSNRPVVLANVSLIPIYGHINGTNNRPHCVHQPYTQYNGQDSGGDYPRQEYHNIADSTDFHSQDPYATTNLRYHPQNALYQHPSDIMSMQRDMIEKQKVLERRIDRQTRALESLCELLAKTTKNPSEIASAAELQSRDLMDIVDPTPSVGCVYPSSSGSVLIPPTKNRTSVLDPSFEQNSLLF